MTNLKPPILYLSYDGILEPLGHSQVYSYLKHLSVTYRMYLISFEKQSDLANSSEMERMRLEMEGLGIDWTFCLYHKSPSVPATLYDLSVAVIKGLWLIKKNSIEIIHSRSYVAGMAGLALKYLTGANLIFDMRGFWPDERVDGGIWHRKGVLYKITKKVEKLLLDQSDHIISLTHVAKRILINEKWLSRSDIPITVIPTCVDLSHFNSPELERGSFIIGYVGSVGTWYDFGVTVRCFEELIKINNNARILILNRGEHDLIREHIARSSIPEDKCDIIECSHSEAALHIKRMTIGVFFIRQCFSKTASSPTKLAEFLSLGVPCITNTGVGDIEHVIERETVGVAIPDFSDKSLREGVKRIIELAEDDNIRDRCIRVAEQEYCLLKGVKQYSIVYEQLQRSRSLRER